MPRHMPKSFYRLIRAATNGKVIEMPKSDTTQEGADSKTKKNKVCTKVYVQADGTETSSASFEAVRLEFRFHDGPGGHIKTVKTVNRGDNPADIETCLDWFGRSEKYGNFFAGVKGNAAEAVESFITGAEILAAGEWKERREGVESRPSMVLAAVLAFLESKGETIDDARKARVKEKVSTTDGRKKARANAEIESHYQTIVAAHAAEKAKSAKDAAKGKDSGLSGF